MKAGEPHLVRSKPAAVPFVSSPPHERVGSLTEDKDAVLMTTTALNLAGCGKLI
jgi:hypothetical protein